jgi:hypothetical protein
MFQWIAENKEWFLSGLGGLVLLGLLGIIKYGYRRWKEGRVNDKPNKSDSPVQYVRIGRNGFIDLCPSNIIRMFLKPERVLPKIHIGLREELPIDLRLDADVSFIDLYFQITNLSPIDILLDRMLIEMWFGQPTFYSAILKQYVLPAGEITKNIFLRYELSSAQVSQIKAFQTNGRRGSICLNLTAFFDSKIGRYEVRKNIERRSI